MADDGGIGRLKARFAAIPKDVKEAVVPMVLKQAEAMAATMRSLAPDDPSTDAPDLKSSIAVTPPGGTTPPYSQPGGSMTLGETTAAVTVGNEDVRYPHLVEYGTVAHDVTKGAGTLAGKAHARLKGGRMHPGTAAQPFFWPAVRMHQKKSRDALRRAVGKAVRKHWGKGS